MTLINRNNLDKSSSPYLLQHISNPVWWQEWSNDLIKYATDNQKPLFVSVGYATCHWCHVMASEAFSDLKTASYLNEHYICIKIDREQRPDIDQFLMDFINSQNGHGGWPLNVFLTSGLRPVFALTYAPVISGDSMLSLLSVAEKVYEFILENNKKIPPFRSVENLSPVAEESSMESVLTAYYDKENGGFGNGQKFPPHSSLLYLLYKLSIKKSDYIESVCVKTLDAIRLRGLNDHLQGGIFRYCVDREWTIPHFEKMLYDQAMSIWCYSLAYRVIGKVEYKTMAERIISCLEESFEFNGLYISAHDADTEHEEGITYLWSYEELKNNLLPEEFKIFSETYYVQKEGNFEGMNHLIRRNDNPLNEIEKKLLDIRKIRKQPSCDKKILCGLNALAVIALIQAGRLLGNHDLESKASLVMHNIIEKFWDGTTLGHSFYNNVLQKQSFLFDAAATLAAISFLFEQDNSWKGILTEMTHYIESFHEGEKWIESRAEDFQIVYASMFDHPVPSSVSLAEMGLSRVAYLTGKEIKAKLYRQPFQSDFYNISVMLNNGLFHIIESGKFISWDLLPVNSIQVFGEHETDCFMGTCRPLNSCRYLI